MAIPRFTREQLLAAPPARFAWRHTVRLQEVDAAGVVFFGHYFALFNDALLAFMEQAGCPAPELINRDRLLAPVKQASADYVAPARFGEKLRIELVAAVIEPTQFTVGYRIVRETDAAVLAVGQTGHVIVDARRFERTEAPEALRAALAAI